MFDYSDNFIHTPNFDLLFVENENTEMFYEEDYFPIFDNDRQSNKVLSLLWYFEDSVDNARYFGDFNPDDDNYAFGFKNGKTVYIGDGTDVRSIRKNIFSEKNLRFIIWENSAETRFWFDGTWEGLLALQQETGWFDLTLYEDWI